MASKFNEINKNTVPGPGSYNAADMDIYLEQKPSYTMAPRTELPSDKSPKPSPNSYEPEKVGTFFCFAAYSLLFCLFLARKIRRA